MAEHRKRTWARVLGALAIMIGVAGLALGASEVPTIVGIACGVIAIAGTLGGERESAG